MKISEWTAEVERIGKALGISERAILELKLWSVDMAYDKLPAAQKRFSGEPL